MTIKVKMRRDKATIRFSSPAEAKFFENLMTSVRDSNPNTHPKISVKDIGNTEIPSLPKPKPLKPIIVKPEPLDMPMKVKPTMLNSGEVIIGSGHAELPRTEEQLRAAVYGSKPKPIKPEI